jgi:hypothetical protein
MSTITIPDDATPADIVGETDILPGQTWLVLEVSLSYAQQMKDGTFPWEKHQRVQPIAYQEGANGSVITQGHHRWVAARLADIALPATVGIRRDYWPGAVPTAKAWKAVVWE